MMIYSKYIVTLQVDNSNGSQSANSDKTKHMKARKDKPYIMHTI